MIENGDGKLEIPSGQAERGELGSDTAERVAASFTDCESKTLKYRKELKKEFEREGESFRWQSYTVEIEGEPEKGEWVSISKLNSHDLVMPLSEMKDKLVDRL